MGHGIEAAGTAETRSPLLHMNTDKPVAALTADETRDAMVEECTGIRLDLIYCGALPGELRKRWANRLGELDLRSPGTPDAIERMHEGLAVFDGEAHERDLDDIRARLWRLRVLCLRYQQLRSGAHG